MDPISSPDPILGRKRIQELLQRRLRRQQPLPVSDRENVHAKVWAGADHRQQPTPWFIIRHRRMTHSTSPSDRLDVTVSVLCLRGIWYALFSSDTRRYPTVNKSLICSKSNCRFCPAVVRQCPRVGRVPQSGSRPSPSTDSSVVNCTTSFW